VIVIESAAAMQRQALAWRAAGEEAGLVPTMGAIHAGHQSLVARAKRENQRVAVSVFVNPKQFGPHEDLASYPRPFERDQALLKEQGIDVLFHPEVDQIYPPSFRTQVDPGPWAKLLEGRSRPGHFAGVLTVVLKLFELTQPKRAYFGQKDIQQLLLVRQLVRDFMLPVRVVGCPTVREPDGLAMSSRNAYLTAGQRAAAPALHQALTAASQAFRRGLTDPEQLERLVRDRLEDVQDLTVDYAQVFSEETLERPQQVREGDVLAIAVKLGSTRLIDNVVFGADRL
jgi:pantoate--beta-alanine ligase